MNEFLFYPLGLLYLYVTHENTRRLGIKMNEFLFYPLGLLYLCTVKSKAYIYNKVWTIL